MREDEWLCPQSASFVLHLSANVFFCFQILDKTCTSFHSKQCSLITKREGHRRLETVVHDKTLIFQKVTTKVHLVPLCALTVNMNAGPKWRQECPTYQYVEQLITGSKRPPHPCQVPSFCTDTITISFQWHSATFLGVNNPPLIADNINLFHGHSW